MLFGARNGKGVYVAPSVNTRCWTTQNHETGLEITRLKPIPSMLLSLLVCQEITQVASVGDCAEARSKQVLHWGDPRRLGVKSCQSPMRAA